MFLNDKKSHHLFIFIFNFVLLYEKLKIISFQFSKPPNKIIFTYYPHN